MLLSPEVQEILSPNTNIIRFQNLFHIIAYKTCTSDFLNFVFDVPLGNEEYKVLPENTKLQKELKKKLLNEKNLHLGLGFLKKEID